MASAKTSRTFSAPVTLVGYMKQWLSEHNEHPIEQVNPEVISDLINSVTNGAISEGKGKKKPWPNQYTHY